MSNEETAMAYFILREMNWTGEELLFVFSSHQSETGSTLPMT